MIFDVSVLLASLSLCWISKWNPKAVSVALMFFTALAYTEFMVSYGDYGHYSDWLVLMTVYLVYTPLMLIVLDLKRSSDCIILFLALTMAFYDYLMFIEWAAYFHIQAYNLGIINEYYTPAMRVMYIGVLLAVCSSTGSWSRLDILYRGLKQAIKDFIHSRRENGRRYRILG